MAVIVSTRVADDLVVITTWGVADADLVETVGANLAVAVADRPSVIDLTDLRLTGEGHLTSLVVVLGRCQAAGLCGVVCGRLTLRRLLARAGWSPSLPLFATVDAAVAARVPHGPGPDEQPGSRDEPSVEVPPVAFALPPASPGAEAR